MTRKHVPLLALALVASACGTRADFPDAPIALRTQVIEETIDPSTGVAAPTGDAQGPVASGVGRRGTRTKLAGGSGIRNGTIKIGGLFPMSGGLSALGVPPAKAAQAYFRWVNDNG